MTGPEKGWYQDPQAPASRERWWTGSAWGEQVRTAGREKAPVVRVRRKTSTLTWIVLAIIAFIVIVAVASRGGGSSNPSNPATASHHDLPATPAVPSDAPAGAVAGQLSRSCDLKCTSPDAARRLSIGPVWCFWAGAHVKVHLKLANPMNARIHLSVTPKYFIEDGGQHGTSFAGDVPMALAAHHGRTFVADAGHPEGVSNGAPISQCAPHLHDIDIG